MRIDFLHFLLYWKYYTNIRNKQHEVAKVLYVDEKFEEFATFVNNLPTSCMRQM